MQKIDINDKISIYGKVDNIDINIKNKRVSEIIKCFYELLLKNNLKINKIKKIKIKEIIFQDNKKIDGRSLFWLHGYSKKKGTDESSMRNYFNIRSFEFRDLYKELKCLYTEYFYYFEKDIKKLDIIVEKLFLDNIVTSN